ncbi:hypothetical protein [Neobacillus rhizosphaerae]|nr:hypothetical protein [Neobacillus rhizosphaerae]
MPCGEESLSLVMGLLRTGGASNPVGAAAAALKDVINLYRT